MEIAPSSAAGITRGSFGPTATSSSSRPQSGSRSKNPHIVRNLLEFTKSLYTDQYRWAIVKGALFFGVGVFVARELSQVDFDEVVMSPPQG